MSAHGIKGTLKFVKCDLAVHILNLLIFETVPSTYLNETNMFVSEISYFKIHINNKMIVIGEKHFDLFGLLIFFIIIKENS